MDTYRRDLKNYPCYRTAWEEYESAMWELDRLENLPGTVARLEETKAKIAKDLREAEAALTKPLSQYARKRGWSAGEYKNPKAQRVAALRARRASTQESLDKAKEDLETVNQARAIIQRKLHNAQEQLKLATQEAETKLAKKLEKQARQGAKQVAREVAHANLKPITIPDTGQAKLYRDLLIDGAKAQDYKPKYASITTGTNGHAQTVTVDWSLLTNLVKQLPAQEDLLLWVEQADDRTTPIRTIDLQNNVQVLAVTYEWGRARLVDQYPVPDLDTIEVIVAT